MLEKLKEIFDSWYSPEKSKTKDTLIISETRSGYWNYHYRALKDNELPNYAGFSKKTYALCGREIGWDTKIPLKVYGNKSEHIPESYCEKCRKIALEKGLI